MSTVYLNLKTADPMVQAIARAAFPGYSGTKVQIRIRPDDASYDVRSYWSGGSRDQFAFVRLADTAASGVVPAQSGFDRPIAGADRVVLPAGLVLVTHTIFCGKDLGLKIDVRQSDSNPALLPPTPADLTDDEKAVIRMFGEVSSYAGQNRQQRSGLPIARWDPAFASLQARGYITKGKALSPAGQTLRASMRGY